MVLLGYLKVINLGSKFMSVASSGDAALQNNGCQLNLMEGI